MKLAFEDQYPDKWISENKPEPPLAECTWVQNPDFPDYGTYILEVDTLEQLISLADRKQSNIFLRVRDLCGGKLQMPEVVFADDLD